MLLVDLAMNETGSPIPLKSIAERQGLSEHYLEQLISPLRNAGFVKSIRGAYGGYVLAKPQTKVTVLDVILTLEGPLCVVDDAIDDGLIELWEKLESAIDTVLTSLSLKDLADMKRREQNSYMFYI
jgi:Rrf2 family cysteine metabolism transcriptional repressor